MLLKAEEVSRNTYFVQRGVVRSFTINDQIIEHVLHFVLKVGGLVICIVISLKTRKFIYRSA